MENKDYLRPMTRTELARLYGIDRKTLYNWIKQLGLPVKNGILTVKCLEIIYQEFGYPGVK